MQAPVDGEVAAAAPAPLGGSQPAHQRTSPHASLVVCGGMGEDGGAPADGEVSGGRGLEQWPEDVLRLLVQSLEPLCFLRLCQTSRFLQLHLPPLAPPAWELSPPSCEHAAPLVLVHGKRFPGVRALELRATPRCSPILSAAASLLGLRALVLHGVGLAPAAQRALEALPAALERLDLVHVVWDPHSRSHRPAPAWAGSLRALSCRNTPVPEHWLGAALAGAFPALSSFSAGPLYTQHMAPLAACPVLTDLTILYSRVCYLRADASSWKQVVGRLTALGFEGCDLSLRQHLVGSASPPLCDALSLCASTLKSLSVCHSGGGRPMGSEFLHALIPAWPRGLEALRLAPVHTSRDFFLLLGQLSPRLKSISLQGAAGQPRQHRQVIRSSSPPRPSPGSFIAGEGASLAACPLHCGFLLRAEDRNDHASHCLNRARHCLSGCGQLFPTARVAAEHALGMKEGGGACPFARFSLRGALGLQFSSPRAARAHVADCERLALISHCPLRWLGCVFSAEGARGQKTAGVLVGEHLQNCCFASYACLGCGEETGLRRGVARCGREGCSKKSKERCAMPHLRGEEGRGEMKERKLVKCAYMP